MGSSMLLRHRGPWLTLLLVLGALTTAGASSTQLVLPESVPAEDRARVMRVTESASIDTHVAAEPFRLRSAIFEYLIDHPEFATHITQTLKLARYRIWNTPEGLFLDDGWGTTGHFTVVHAAQGLRVMYAWGQYKPKMLPSIRGQAVVRITFGFQPDGNGRDVVNTAITGLVKLDSRILAAATRLAHNIAQSKADAEGRRLVKVFSKVSQAVEENPAGLYDQLRQRPETPRRELAEFRQLLNLR